jgi:hypothetical protein
LPRWLLSSNSSLQEPQKKSASGLLFGNDEILALPQCGQYAQARTHASVQARALCEPLENGDWDSSKPSFMSLVTQNSYVEFEVFIGRKLKFSSDSFPNRR